MTRIIAVSAAAVATAFLAGCQLPQFVSHSPSETTAHNQNSKPDDQPLTQQPNKIVPPLKPNVATLSKATKKVTIHEKVIHIPTYVEGRLLLGAEEKAYFPNLNISLPAKIDTGAEKTSIDARNYKLFERDGKRWVKFTLFRPNHDAIPMEYPVIEMTRIKRPGKKSMVRPVIRMTLRISNLTQQVDVTLNDREGFNFPLLIGRNFIRDLVVIDVNQREIGEQKLLSEKTFQETANSANDGNETVQRIINKSVDVHNIPVIGAVENITFQANNNTLKARIDTGAKTSSLDARNIKIFKRNGKQWVRFDSPTDNNNMVSIEQPIVRFVKIKRHHASSEHRPVIKIGNKHR